MYDYQKFALMLSPIEEKDLILFEMSAEDKAYAVKQFNRALLNAQRDGTDVAQIILKPLISKYPAWGDLALIYGICLAREEEFKRAEDAFNYAVNNTLASEHNLSIAQEAMKYVKDDIKKAPAKPEVPKSGKNWTSLAASDGKPTNRKGMQAPILVKATNRTNDFQMASSRERRDIMMRSASGGDEMASDDINVENVRTSADNLRLTVKVIAVMILVAIVFVVVYFGVIPMASRLKTAKDTKQRLDYIMDKLEEHKDDPEVASIIAEYAENYDNGSAASSAIGAETATVGESENMAESVNESGDEPAV